MRLSEIVANLANAVRVSRQPLTDREDYLLYILQGLPQFRNVKRFDLWEAAYQQVSPDNGLSDTELIIEELFELGQYNIYGFFNASGTLEYYNEVVAKFIQIGIQLPTNQTISEIYGW